MKKEKRLLRLLGKNIRKIRLQRKMSQEELALSCFIDQSYITKIEKSKVNPTIKTLYKIARKLKVKLSYLFE